MAGGSQSASQDTPGKVSCAWKFCFVSSVLSWVGFQLVRRPGVGHVLLGACGGRGHIWENGVELTAGIENKK
jgi:hypothetical protein